LDDKYRVLGTERRKEQVQQVMRQGMPEENGIMQQQRQKDLNNRVDQGTASQMSRRHKQMMRRLWDGEQQREEVEQELRNLMSQVHGHKQEQEEHDDVGSEKASYTTSVISKMRNSTGRSKYGRISLTRKILQRADGRQCSKEQHNQRRKQLN